MCKYLTVLPFIIISFALSAQKPIDYNKMKTFNIVVNNDDCTVKTQMLTEGRTKPADEDLTYFWFTSNKIISTRGGFDGKLLHGYYKCFYLNNNLKESGNFKYGLKKGEWRYWFENGRLKEIIHWKNGKKHGAYRLYNESGELIGKGNFKSDKLNGKFKTYSKGKLTETVKYKEGEVIPAKIRKQKVKTAKFEEVPLENKEKKEKKTLKEKWNGLFKKKNKEVKKKELTQKPKEKKVKKEKAGKPKKTKEKKKKETKVKKDTVK